MQIKPTSTMPNPGPPA